MRRKEIFFKQLSFILGVLIVLSFIEGKEITLPAQSETRLLQVRGDIVRLKTVLIIKQEKSKISIILLSGSEPSGDLRTRGIKEGIISIPEFKSFWDSLNSIDFWRLKGTYKGQMEFIGDIEGELSVSFAEDESVKMTKTVRFYIPQNCPEEFKRVYSLVQDMGKYSQNPPDLSKLLEYGETGGSWYQELADAEISRIKDPKYLDTLLILLPKETKYEEGITLALKNIADKKAVPVIKNFLDQLDLREPSWERTRIILAALDALSTIEQRKSIDILKKYLNNNYELWVRDRVSIMLIQLKDYTAIPNLISFLKENFTNFYVFLALGQISKDKKVISAIIQALKEEMNGKELNDKRIGGLINGLPILTGQENFSYNSSDSLEAKKENINKWINWWEENKNKLK